MVSNEVVVGFLAAVFEDEGVANHRVSKVSEHRLCEHLLCLFTRDAASFGMNKRGIPCQPHTHTDALFLEMIGAHTGDLP